MTHQNCGNQSLIPRSNFFEIPDAPNFMNLHKEWSVIIDCGGNLQKENWYYYVNINLTTPAQIYATCPAK